MTIFYGAVVARRHGEGGGERSNPFTRREDRQLRFSSHGIDSYIRRKARNV